jgi:uncharacterized protein YndB with AHSA1/START domain
MSVNMKNRALLMGAVMSLCGTGAMAGDEGATGKAGEVRAAATPGVTLSPQVTEGVVNAPVEEVWKAFATAEGFKLWGVAQCDLELRVGGLIRTHYKADGVLGDEGTIYNQVLAFEEPTMFAFRIVKPPAGFPFKEETWASTWSVATMTPTSDGKTRLRLAGMGYPDTEDGRKMRDFFLAGNAWSMKKLEEKFGAARDEQGGAPARGGVHETPALAPVEHERVVAMARDEVWRNLTTSAGWKAWIGVDSKIELSPGGAFEVYFGSEAPEGERGSEGCNVLSYVPGRMLSFTWNASPKHAHARSKRTWVVIELADAGPGMTRVTLRPLGFTEQATQHPEHEAEWKAVRAYFQSAWGRVLDEMTRYASSAR